MKNAKPHISDPCPMTLSRMKSGDSFFCKSCDKKIVDFRNKTTEEIISYFKNGTGYGIFYEDQVTTSTYSFKNKFLYKLLTVLALLGLNVRPLNAQSKKDLLNDPASLERRTVHTDKPVENKGDTKTENKEEIKDAANVQIKTVKPKKHSKRWRRKHRRVMGYMAF
jgi:hypothetical protein